MNKKGFAVSGIIYSILILFLILIFSILSILGGRKLILDKLKNDVMNELNDEVFELAYRDRSGANRPELLSNMIPIRYDGNNWVYADIYEEWYNYENQEWANAVVLNDGVTKNVGETITEEEIALWYVWIPRYKYQLFNANNEGVPEQLINIAFENGTETTGTVSCIDAINQTDGSGNLISETCTNASNGNWYTHPAFTFGDEQLTGFWVGKFEVSQSTENDQLKIIPGVHTLTNLYLSSYFGSIQNISENYQISGDSHMMKNMEWGAVAYLKQSKYGLGIENLEKGEGNYYTGGGETPTAYKENIGFSTTGNIYGIYDMTTASGEYMAGVIVSEDGSLKDGDAGFGNFNIDKKYYDLYTYDSISTSYTRGKLGDATKETMFQLTNNGAWYNSLSRFPNTRNIWFFRGGSYMSNAGTGIFHFSYNSGIYFWGHGARAVLSL